MQSSKLIRWSAARRLGVFVLSTLGATACLSGVDTTGPAASAAGTYTLTTVDITPPPVVISVSGATSISIQSAAFLLGSDGSAQHIVTSFATTNGVQGAMVTDTGTGTFAVTDSQVVVTLGTAAPDTLALTSGINETLIWNRSAVVGGTVGLHAFHYTKL